MRTESSRWGAAAARVALAAGAWVAVGSAPVADGSERMIVKEVVVQAAPAAAWRLWTTSDGVVSFAPPKAHIDFRVGGAYEWYFVPDAPEGQRGSEGCTILGYIPERMLAFTWNAPPSIPAIRDSGGRTQVVVEFEAVEAGRTRVRLTQHGFGTGPDWDKYHAYFDKAWGKVLEGMAQHLEKGRGSSARGTYIYFISPARAGFMLAPTTDEQKLVGEHFQYLKDLHQKGVVRFAGRAIDPGAYPTGVEKGVMLEMPACGLVVFDAPDADTARKILEGDPAVRAGVFKGKVFPFGVALESASRSDEATKGKS